MKNLLAILVILGTFVSCNRKAKIEAEQTNNEPISQQIHEETPELSIYNLPATWTTQDNEEIQLEDLKGKVLVMTMIYTSCSTACPQLIAGMRNIEDQLPEDVKDEVKFIIVSIDPETDTPQRLKEFSEANNLDDNQWVFLRGTPSDTREFATVLAVSYKKISPINFSHSNIISIFNEQGVMVFQKEGLGLDFGESVEAIITEVNN